ncbi:MAG: hypothetical protein MRY83_02105, partial [Flavobacteriales bacterium]|nr:hypothetical protein [Flavobacteriales bacterium]
MRIILIISICFLGLIGKTQNKHLVWVGFSDKGCSEHLIEQPLKILSEEALDRRSRAGIALDATDLPVCVEYLKSIANLGHEIIAVSKWQNMALVSLNNVLDIEDIERLNFVAFVRKKRNFRIDLYPTVLKSLDYGVAFGQNEMIKVPYLHDLGLTGSGLTIAVLDAGFRGVDTMSAFRHIRE